MEDFLKCRWKI